MGKKAELVCLDLDYFSLNTTHVAGLNIQQMRAQPRPETS